MILRGPLLPSIPWYRKLMDKCTSSIKAVFLWAHKKGGKDKERREIGRGDTRFF
jgi:hypothetical protein